MYYAGKMTEMSIKLNGLIASALFLIPCLILYTPWFSIWACKKEKYDSFIDSNPLKDLHNIRKITMTLADHSGSSRWWEREQCIYIKLWRITEMVTHWQIAWHSPQTGLGTEESLGHHYYRQLGGRCEATTVTKNSQWRFPYLPVKWWVITTCVYRCYLQISWANIDRRIPK